MPICNQPVLSQGKKKKKIFLLPHTLYFQRKARENFLGFRRKEYTWMSYMILTESKNEKEGKPTLCNWQNVNMDCGLEKNIVF